MEGSPLRAAFKNLILQAVSELKTETVNTDPEEGTVTDVASDGTVTVQTSSGNIYGTVGAAVVFVIGAQVMVLTGDGRKVAVPR